MTAELANRPRTNSAVDSPLIGEVQAALGDLARALAKQLVVLLVDVEKKAGGAEALAKEVNELVPKVLEQQFMAQFLVDEEGARRHRAVLAHLLSTIELTRVAGAGAKGLAVPWPELPPVLASAEAEAESEEMTSEAAAKLLHVSRTHVNTLADTGVLGEVRLTFGGHRRLSKAAVIKYREQSKARQAKGLAEMAEASERLGLYDDELAGIPQRRKK